MTDPLARIRAQYRYNCIDLFCVRFAAHLRADLESEMASSCLTLRTASRAKLVMSSTSNPDMNRSTVAASRRSSASELHAMGSASRGTFVGVPSL